MSILVTATVTRLAPLRATAHKIRGVQYRKPIPPEMWTETRTIGHLAPVSDRALLPEGRVKDKDVLRRRHAIRAVLASVIRVRRLPVDHGSLREDWTELDDGLVRGRRAWKCPASGDRYVVEVSVEPSPEPGLPVPARAFRERTIGPISDGVHRTTSTRVEHTLVPLDRDLICSCGQGLRRGQSISTIDALHARVMAEAGLTRTCAPV